MKKVIFVANIGFTITNFRSELIQQLLQKGHEVKIVCSDKLDFNNKLKEVGVDVIPLSLSRKSLNPFKNLLSLLQLVKIFRKEKADIVLNYTIKPVIFSSLAARIANVKIVCSFITGLGYIFTQDSIKTRLLRNIIKVLYRFSLKKNFRIFFQNNDDLDLFIKLKLVDTDVTRITNGSGVNLKNFFPAEVKKIENSFVLVGRILKDKGVGEFVAAARLMKEKYPQTSFWLCGSIDDNPASYSIEDVNAWSNEGIINYSDHINNVNFYLADKEVFVLPSYREGTPRSVLEAMAMGMPIITTNAPGCRETTRDGHNGYLVKPRNIEQLYEAMERFILNPEIKEFMGKKSLEMAVEKYDVNLVNEKILKDLRL